jgi:hypothetical protein
MQSDRRKPFKEQIVHEGPCEVCGELSLALEKTSEGTLCPACAKNSA